MPKGDLNRLPRAASCGYPEPFNRSTAPATFLAIGPNFPEIDVCTCPDIGMVLDRNGYRFLAATPGGDQNS
jgi:uncharacterized cupin superfamily protein